MKKYLKLIVHSIFVFLVSPLYLLYLVFRLTGGKAAFASFSQFLSLIPGKVGSLTRIAFYRLAMSRCHHDCVIGFGTIFSQANTQIGRGVYIGPQCNIGACQIGDSALVASGVHILSGSRQHNYDDINKPIQEQGGELSQISIGIDAWIGNGALVMSNVGAKAVIGAGSVVTKDIPDFSIAVGNPAKVVKSRV